MHATEQARAASPARRSTSLLSKERYEPLLSLDRLIAVTTEAHNNAAKELASAEACAAPHAALPASGLKVRARGAARWLVPLTRGSRAHGAAR